MSEERPLQVVVAPTWAWFADWCHQNRVSPHSRRVVPVTSHSAVERLRGVRDAEVHVLAYPRWWTSGHSELLRLAGERR